MTSKISKFTIVFLLAFANSSCGFRPLYQDPKSNSDQNFSQQLAAVKIDIGRQEINQKLINRLQNILDPNNLQLSPKYLLTIDLKKTVRPTFITDSGASGRNKVILTAKYQLKDLDSEEIIGSGTALAKDDFDVEEKRFANYIAEQEITANLTVLIADNLRNLLVQDFVIFSRSIKN